MWAAQEKSLHIKFTEDVMAISPVDPTTAFQVTNEIKKKSNASSEDPQITDMQSTQNAADKVQLSPEAKKLHETQTQNKLSEILGKIDSGFYNSDEVISSVASSLVKVIRNG